MLEPHRARWDELARASRNVFATWEFADTWLRLHGSDLRLRVDDRAIVPLVRERRGPLRLLRFVGHGAADGLGPVCAPGDRATAAALVREELAAGGWDVFAAELLPADPAWSALGARLVAQAASPVLRFDGDDWDGYLSSRSRNLREQVRRRERRANDAGATFRLACASSLERDLDTLFALHRERWGSSSTFGRNELFHRAFARVSLERGWLRLWLLELDGGTAAAWYGFRFEGVESYYQAGRSRRFDALSPGLVLLAHTIREAQQDGMTEYRFLRGDEAFKLRFADDDDGLLTYATARGPLGSVALAGVLAGRRLR